MLFLSPCGRWSSVQPAPKVERLRMVRKTRNVSFQTDIGAGGGDDGALRRVEIMCGNEYDCQGLPALEYAATSARSRWSLIETPLNRCPLSLYLVAFAGICENLWVVLWLTDGFTPKENIVVKK